jgi:hypothetical protein
MSLPVASGQAFGGEVYLPPAAHESSRARLESVNQNPGQPYQGTSDESELEA